MDAGVAHRGPMSDDVSVLQRDLERYRINNESLTMDLKMAIQNNNRGAAAAKGSCPPAPRGSRPAPR